MPDVRFAVDTAEVARSSAVPALNFRLRVENRPPGERVQSILLRTQVQIEPARRRYTTEEQGGLYELFDRPERWTKTVQPLLWANAVTVIPSFCGSTTVELPIACSYDFNLAATKYFHALSEGEVPLSFLFSGSVFYEGASGNLQVGQLPWDREAKFRLPVSLWKEVMNCFYSSSVWLCLRDDAFNRLNDYKVRHGLPSFEAALEAMLATAAEGTKV